jgi:hypothetical protein
MNLSPGQGENMLHRWAYHPDKKSCVTFVYNGDGGNQNNFLTKSDCINTCVGESSKKLGSYYTIGREEGIHVKIFSGNDPSRGKNM